MDIADMLLRLGVALAAGTLVGVERERRDRPAGLRTHILVCTGSALITLVSIGMAPGHSDPTRIAAQIVSGIGFLGAGTIFRSGAFVRGLTTAAGLWMVAGIGMAIASGGTLLYAGILAALAMWVINQWVRVVEDRWVRGHESLVLATSRKHDVLARVFEGLAERGVRVERVEWIEEDADEHHATVRLRLGVSAEAGTAVLTPWLGSLEGVREVRWD